MSAGGPPAIPARGRRRVHIPNNFTAVRTFLVFYRCRICTDTRRADRRLSAVVIAMLTVSPPACSAL